MRGFVFDMDDTLYKEQRYRDSGYRTIARHFAAPCGVSPDELYRLMQEDLTQAFERVRDLAAARGVEVTVDQQLTVYRSHRPDITLDPVAESVLSKLHDAGVPMGLVTDGRAWGQLNKINALGLGRFFRPDTLIATVLYHTDKHSPEPFRMIEKRLRDLGATTMTYVGDNPSKDFLHPNLMGWNTVMLRDIRDENIHRQRILDWAPENRPQLVVESLDELLHLS